MTLVMFARQTGQMSGVTSRFATSHSHNSHKSERFRSGLMLNLHVMPRGKLQRSRLLWLLHLPLHAGSGAADVVG